MLRLLSNHVPYDYLLYGRHETYRDSHNLIERGDKTF